MLGAVFRNRSRDNSGNDPAVPASVSALLLLLLINLSSINEWKP
jgi:hypothetical protein